MRTPIVSGDTVIWVEADTAEMLYAAVANKIEGVVIETDDGLVVEQSGFRRWALREVARLENEAQRGVLRPGDIVLVGQMARQTGKTQRETTSPFDAARTAILNATGDGEIITTLVALAKML